MITFVNCQLSIVNCFKPSPEQCQVVECLVFVAEMIVVLPDEYSIAVSIFIHPWQTGVRVRLPRMNHVPHVLRLRHLAQILNFIIRRVEVYVVQLHRGKMPVMPSPDGTVH